MGDPEEVAHHIITDGPAVSLSRVPIVIFGKMMRPTDKKPNLPRKYQSIPKVIRGTSKETSLCRCICPPGRRHYVNNTE